MPDIDVIPKRGGRFQNNDPLANYSFGTYGSTQANAVNEQNSQVGNGGGNSNNPYADITKHSSTWNVSTNIRGRLNRPPNGRGGGQVQNSAQNIEGSDAYTGQLGDAKNSSGGYDNSGINPGGMYDEEVDPNGKVPFDKKNTGGGKNRAAGSGNGGGQPGGGAPKPDNTEDPNVAAAWYRTFPGYENVTVEDVTAYRMDPKGLPFDQWYKSGNRGQANPKPEGTEDPAIAAKWYSGFKGFEGVTTADVIAYRNNPQGMSFSDWYQKGNRGQQPNQNPGTGTGGGTGAGTGHGGGKPYQGGNGGGTGKPVTNTPAPPDDPITTGAGDRYSLDALKEATRRQAERALMEKQRDIRASMALSGMSRSGALDSSMADSGISAEANLQQAFATMEHDSWNQQQERDLKQIISESGNNTQLAIAKIQAAAQKYAAQVQAEAAAAGASAQVAAAQAQAAANKYEADLRYQLGLGQLDVDRENNMMDFTNQQNDLMLRYIDKILGISPDASIGNAQWPGGNILTSGGTHNYNG